MPMTAYLARVPCHAVQCSVCNARVGRNCVKRDGTKRFSSHKARCLAASKAATP